MHTLLKPAPQSCIRYAGTRVERAGPTRHRLRKMTAADGEKKNDINIPPYHMYILRNGH